MTHRIPDAAPVERLSRHSIGIRAVEAGIITDFPQRLALNKRVWLLDNVVRHVALYRPVAQYRREGSVRQLFIFA